MKANAAENQISYDPSNAFDEDTPSVKSNASFSGVQSTGKLGDGKARSAVDIISYPNVRLCDIVGVILHSEKVALVQAQEDKEAECDSDGVERLGDAEEGNNFDELEFLLVNSARFNALQYSSIEAACKYFHYTENQAVEMAKWSRRSSVQIPDGLVYDRSTFPSLSGEELEKLSLFRPETLDQAARLEGITPGAIVQLHRAIAKLKESNTHVP